MSDTRRLLDVWIVETKKVYREVPFNVVADWVQQGRLLDDDRLRPAGAGEWQRVADFPEFRPYQPQPEPHRADDTAEALEPVEFEVAAAPRRRDEDDDPDMIPLIDVSLVLLIFFMMTAAGGVVASPIKTPESTVGQAVEARGITIGLDLVGEDRVPVYSLASASEAPAPEDAELRTLAELVQRLDDRLAQTAEPIEVTVNAHEDAPAGLVSDLMSELGQKSRREKITAIYWGTSEKPQ
jgi:biopolymer transport protein ExbD